MSGRPSAFELTQRPGAFLNRTDLRDLGWGRAAIDAIFRRLDVVGLPGTERPMIRREDYLELVEKSTYGAGQVRPTLATLRERQRAPGRHRGNGDRPDSTEPDMEARS